MRPVEEPGCVEEEGEGGLGLGVVLQKVLQKSENPWPLIGRLESWRVFSLLRSVLKFH